MAGQEYGEEHGSEDEDDRANVDPPVMPEFDRADAEGRFDDENPEVIIPDEVVDHVDNDWLLDEDEKEQLVTQYHANLAAA